MSTLHVNLPDALRHFAEQQVTTGRYAIIDTYLTTLIRDDQRHELELEKHLRPRLAAGPSTPMPDADFDRIREQLRRRAAARANS